MKTVTIACLMVMGVLGTVALPSEARVDTFYVNNIFLFRNIGISATGGLFEDIYIYDNTF